MKISTQLRCIGAIILLAILSFSGAYNINGIPLLLMTFGFAALYEYALVRPVIKRENNKG
jgi:4-hydroxybenzoate polyprenyltransferase